jgi:aspartate-semialdehyde dehydrogenase
MEKIKVAVLGATGMVGQLFLWKLANHPWFDLAVATASDGKAGKLFDEASKWVLPVSKPRYIIDLRLQELQVNQLLDSGVEIVFSALPTDVAKEIEPRLAAAGIGVFSNASAYRYQDDVPILIPEVNSEDLAMIEKQQYSERGFIVTNSNCSTSGLAIALAPLAKFGIEELAVSTYQSISGAGYPGLSALDIAGNLIPYIDGEEEKIARELKKINKLEAEVFATCVRVPVSFGHLETVWLQCAQQFDIEEVKAAWSSFAMAESLPSSPDKLIILHDSPEQPQPSSIFRDDGDGMAVQIGRIRKQGQKLGFTLLVNNLVRGAAGGSLLNAELFASSYRN